MRAQVIVLAAPGRDLAHERLRASLHASDVGYDYVWSEHPPGVSKLDHWSATFLSMERSASDRVILLEDDALVNRHLLHNVESWSWPDTPGFGAGWLYSPGAYCAARDCWYTARNPLWCGTVGVVYRRDDLRKIHDVAMDWMKDRGPAWDLAVAWAVHYLGKKIRQHGPPIVEHQWDAPSVVGNKQSETWWQGSTRGTFQQDWRRA